MTASCPHGIVYGLKIILRSESVRDHMDLLLSFRKFPMIIVSDLSSMLAQHAENRCPGIFSPHQGRLAEPTEANLAACRDGSFQADIPALDGNNFDNNAPRYSLADRFHQTNLSSEKDLLRRVSFVKQLAGRVNTQIQEQLFREMGRNAYFLTQLRPDNYLLLLRLIVNFHNTNVNHRQLASIEKCVRESGQPLKASLAVSASLKLFAHLQSACPSAALCRNPSHRQVRLLLEAE